jgi:flagellar biosynthesis/type III secretory pathway protein FliH
MTEETKVRLELIVRKAVEQAYEIGYSEGLNHGYARASKTIEETGEELVKIYRKQAKHPSCDGE